MFWKSKLNRLTLIVLLLLVLGIIFSDPIGIGLCSQYDYDCDDLIGGTYAMPTFYFSLASFFFLVIARWVKEQTFNSWLRFAKYYIPISLILIFLSPVTSASIIGFDSELATWWLAGLFFVISLGLIIVKSRR